MDVKGLRELLLNRLYTELQLFKERTLRKEKDEIFKASYKIEIYVNLYEILAVHTDNLQEDVIWELLSLNFGILESLYQKWLDREDIFYDELRDYACSELDAISELGNMDHGKEDEDGTESDQAA